MIKNNYLSKLQKKCDLSDDFMKIIDLLFEKLINFGYITKLDINKFSKKLYNNIETVIIGDTHSLDYKSGYYNAPKKELYIKDITNTSSVFLRLLYVLTTNSNSNNTFNSGYTNISNSKKSYSFEYGFFGINRAIISNVVCRLLYTLPQTLSIVPTYRSYNNNFLGSNFTADNDIYFLEGILLRQICYIYNINEEELYSNLFSTKKNKLKPFQNNNLNDLLIILDDISKSYSNYNKLCFLNKLLNDNYLQIKKVGLNNNAELKEFMIKEKTIIRAIKDVISKMSKKELEEDNLETSLTENLDDLEELIISSISSLQTSLINHYISTKSTINSIDYAKNLKKIESMLIIKNHTLYKEIYKTITEDIIHTDENSCTNLVSKIKYSLANYMLGKEKYTKLFDELNFKIIKGINKNDDDICVIINSGLLNEIAYVNGLESNMHELFNNIEFLQSKNLKYLLNTNTKQTENIENLFTKLVNEFEIFKNISINDIYMYDAHTENLLLVIANNEKHIVLLENDKFKLLNLSEDYNLIPSTYNLPTIYKKNKLNKIFKFFKK